MFTDIHPEAEPASRADYFENLILSGRDNFGVYTSILREIRELGDIKYSLRITDTLYDPLFNTLGVKDVNGFWCLFGNPRSSIIKIGIHPYFIKSPVMMDCVIVTLAHELGHHFDLSKRSDVDNVLNAYHVGRENLMRPKDAQTRKDQTIMYNMEDRAWGIGFEILKRHGYRNFPYFMELMEDSLASYAGPCLL